MARVTVVSDKAAMSEAAAERITSLIELGIAARGHAAVSLTGGETPDLLYRLLADEQRVWRHRIEWARVHLFWGDERNVPPDDSESNFGMANRLLLRHVSAPETQVHRIRGELPPSDAGCLYDALLRVRRDQTEGFLFDVMLLGIGANAHIASIFPHSPLWVHGPDGSAKSPDKLATGVFVPELSQWRITMTPPPLLDSATIILIANGSSKADAVAAALEGPLDVERFPAQLLRSAGDRVESIIDAAAAARLRDGPRV